MRTLLSLLLLLLWGLILSLGVAVYVLDGDKAAREAGRRLSSPQDGVSVSVDRVGLSLFPRPGLRFSGLIVRLAPRPGRAFPGGLSLYAEACVVRPAWSSLVRGEIRLASLYLDRPSALAAPQSLPEPAATPRRTVAPPSAAASGPTPDFKGLFSALKVGVRNGSLEWQGSTVLRLAGLDGDMVLPAFADPLPRTGERLSPARLNLRVGSLDLSARADAAAPDAQEKDGAHRLSLRDLRLELEHIWFAGPEAPRRKALLGAALPLPGDLPVDMADTVLGALIRADLRVSLDIASLLAPAGGAAAEGTSGPYRTPVPPLNAACRLTCSARLDSGERGPTLAGELTLRGDLPVKGYATPVDAQVPFMLEPAVPDPTASLSGALTQALADTLSAPTGARPATPSALGPSGAQAGATAASSPAAPGEATASPGTAAPPPVLRVDGGRLVLDGNTAEFSARLLPGKALAFLPAFRGVTDVPCLEGRISVQRLSLPRWFGFARRLPDGVSNALDQLTGKLAFTLTPAALTVSRLEASALGMTFTGTGGVPDMRHPVIVLDAATRKADVNAVLPELAGRRAKGPAYSMPPFIDVDDEPRKPGDLGFDIRLAAEHADFWKLSGQGLMFRVLPLTEPGQDGTRLDIALSSFYKGRLEAMLILDKDAAVSVSLHEVDAEAPVTRIAGEPRLGGLLSAKADLRRAGGLGESVPDFAAKLQASLEINFKNGFWMLEGATPGDKAERQAFSSAAFSFKGQGTGGAQGKKEPDTLPYAGDWKVELVTPDWNGELRLEGNVDFSTRTWMPVRAVKTPGRITAAIGDYRLSASGKVSFDDAARTVSFLDAQGEARPAGAPSSLPVALSGEVLVAPAAGGGRATSGNIALSAPTLRPYLWNALPATTLARMPTDALRRLTAAGSFSISEREWRLTGLKGRLDATTFSGALTRLANAGKRPRWNVDLRIGTLDVNRYLPSAPAGPGSAGNAAFVRFLEEARGIDLAGRLRADQLTLFKLRHDNLNVPLALEKGNFTADPISATVFGGKMGAGFKAEVLPTGVTSPPTRPTGAYLRLRYTLAGADMLALSRARDMDSLVSGTATFEGDFHGMMRDPDDIPAAFSGSWAFDIQDGAITSATAKPGAAGTTFTALRGTGLLTKGVLSNADLQLSGNGLSAVGHGKIDLVSKTLDYYLNVSLLGVPNIPIHYYGSLDHPERSVNAAEAIAGTLSNLGSGVFNLLEGVISAPFRLLRP